MTDVKNIEQYVAKIIAIELRKQNEELQKMKEELEKLRYLASKVYHCSVCYTPDECKFNTDVIIHICYTCEKIVCNNQNCREGWLLEFPKKGYEADYCSRKCYEEDV